MPLHELSHPAMRGHLRTFTSALKVMNEKLCVACIHIQHYGVHSIKEVVSELSVEKAQRSGEE